MGRRAASERPFSTCIIRQKGLINKGSNAIVWLSIHNSVPAATLTYIIFFYLHNQQTFNRFPIFIFQFNIIIIKGY